MQKLRWIWRILWSRTYVIQTDTGSVINIPILELDSLEDAFIIAAQKAMLEDFADKLEALIGEHNEATKLITFREENARKQKQTRKTNPRSGSTSRTPKKKVNTK